MANRSSYPPSSTHCPEGHEFTSENTSLTTTGRKVCKICSRVYCQRHRGRSIDDTTPISTPNGKKTHCKQGHEFSPENTRMQRKGSKWIRVCQECSRRHKIKLRYALSQDQYLVLLDRFDGNCWICKTNPATEVDHDHTCCPATQGCKKCVRGILCHQCNIALGMFKDSPELLQAAIKYLSS